MLPAEDDAGVADCADVVGLSRYLVINDRHLKLCAPPNGGAQMLFYYDFGRFSALAADVDAGEE